MRVEARPYRGTAEREFVRVRLAGQRVEEAHLIRQFPQLRQEVVGFDEPIGPGDPDFRGSGLKAPSLIRLGYLAVLPASGLLGAIGSISEIRHVRLLERLSTHLRPAGETQKSVPGQA